MDLHLSSPECSGMRSSVIIDSYSTLLLVALNPNLMAYSSLLLSGEIKTPPPLAALLVEEPSICITHSSWSASCCCLFGVPVSVSNAMNFVIAWPLITPQGWYLMSNSLNSTDYLTNLLKVSGLWSIALSD